jgi:GTP cyclohydrolase II
MTHAALPCPVQVRTTVLLPMDGDSTAELLSFNGLAPGDEHFALKFPSRHADSVPLVRLHSECITGDLFRSQRCDCGAQLRESIERISQDGGVILYLRQEGRGIGLYAKIDAYRLQEQGLDTFEANEHLGLPRDAREYDTAAAMLRALGINRLRLLTNNPRKADGLRQHGLCVEQVLPTGSYLTPHNARYLEAKERVTHHTLTIPRSASSHSTA